VVLSLDQVIKNGFTNITHLCDIHACRSKEIADLEDFSRKSLTFQHVGGSCDMMLRAIEEWA
jgi:hypothetical protein